MEIFKDIPEYWQRIDFALMQNGPMNLYSSNEVLDLDIVALKKLDYSIEIFDSSTWENEDMMYESLATQLKFPEYFGKNLDALNDCLSDLEISERAGLVFVFNNYDAFAGIERHTAERILDIVHSISYRFLLTGRRVIGLIQSNDPSISFEVGSQNIRWNSKEWLNGSRGL